MKYLVVSIHPNGEPGGFRVEPRYFEVESLGHAEEQAFLDIHKIDGVVTYGIIPFEVPLWVQGIPEVDPMADPMADPKEEFEQPCETVPETIDDVWQD